MLNTRMCLPSEIVRRAQIQRRWQQPVSIFQKSIIEQLFITITTVLFAAGQAGVLQENIGNFLKGKPLTAQYDGYASCPLVTGYNSCILAEFNYDLQPLETFPFRQDVERYSMYVVKRDVLPDLYWHLMLNGQWNGPAKFRKFLSIFKFNK